ncbi:ROK family protein [Sphingobium abikonense]|uniref:ROK family protein n=1 Tax=Sphingobium abikonense TaxID=86193 RepID=UPI0035170B61
MSERAVPPSDIRRYGGIELGGTKCICTLASGPNEILDQRTIPTRSPEETLSAIVMVLQDWHDGEGFEALGIGAFGPIDIDPISPSYGHVLSTPKPGWSGTDLVSALTRSFDVPWGFDTDVNGAAMAEIRWGSGQGLRDFAYVTVGTGIGVGLVVHGFPTRGIGHSEAGHIRVPLMAGDDFSSLCPYHDDCVEGLASGPALIARLQGRSLEHIARDDPVWNPIIDSLAKMLHALVCTAGPVRIAMGGGVLAHQPHLLERIEGALRGSLNGYMALPMDEPYIVAPVLGNQAGPLGTIALAIAAQEKAFT